MMRANSALIGLAMAAAAMGGLHQPGVIALHVLLSEITMPSRSRWEKSNKRRRSRYEVRGW